jgi:large conductance mechanosensitive channel
MLKGFRDFLLRGNIIELATAVVVGTAFTALVAAFGDAFIQPLIKALTGGAVGGAFTIAGVQFSYGLFITALINFVIIAAIVYFLVIVPMSKLMVRLRTKEEQPTEAEATEIALLVEIRDLLKAQRAKE